MKCNWTLKPEGKAETEGFIRSCCCDVDPTKVASVYVRRLQQDEEPPSSCMVDSLPHTSIRSHDHLPLVFEEVLGGEPVRKSVRTTTWTIDLLQCLLPAFRFRDPLRCIFLHKAREGRCGVRG